MAGSEDSQKYDATLSPELPLPASIGISVASPSGGEPMRRTLSPGILVGLMAAMLTWSCQQQVFEGQHAGDCSDGQNKSGEDGNEAL
jgi:hypothetical protein